MRHGSSDGTWFFLAQSGQWNRTSLAPCSDRRNLILLKIERLRLLGQSGQVFDYLVGSIDSIRRHSWRGLSA